MIGFDSFLFRLSVEQKNFTDGIESLHRRYFRWRLSGCAGLVMMSRSRADDAILWQRVRSARSKWKQHL